MQLSASRMFISQIVLYLPYLLNLKYSTYWRMMTISSEHCSWGKSKETLLPDLIGSSEKEIFSDSLRSHNLPHSNTH